MPLTFGEAREFVAEYAGQGGKCASSEAVRIFLLEVLDYMRISGQYGAYRQFVFRAERGCITLPYELEVPLKVKIGESIGTVWDKWFDFHSNSTLEGQGCFEAEKALIEDPNTYPIVYDIPSCGSKIGAQTTCVEEPDAHIIIQGKDLYGRDIFTMHKGEKISGEYLTLEKGKLKYTSTIFKNVTGVVKTQTNGYVQLYWVNEAQDQKGFLSEYSPVETIPNYRRFRLKTNCPFGAKVTVLGKIRLKSYYSDNDLIPFDSIVALKTAAQARNANNNNDSATAGYKDQFMQDVISRENEFKKINNGQPIEVYQPLSAGRIQNIIGGRRRGFGFGRY